LFENYFKNAVVKLQTPCHGLHSGFLPSERVIKRFFKRLAIFFRPGRACWSLPLGYLFFDNKLQLIMLFLFRNLDFFPLLLQIGLLKSGPGRTLEKFLCKTGFRPANQIKHGVTAPY
jgi:hypothetical protein